MFKVSSTFAHSQSKTCRQFRSLFATVSMQQKGVLVYIWDKIDEIWIHHFTPESNRQSAEWTAAGESCLKRPKMQTSAGKVLTFIFWNAQHILFILRKEEP